MKLTKLNDSEMLIEDAETFDVKQTLESGQVFRFSENNNEFFVQSLDKVAKICKLSAKKYLLSSKNLNFFENFFDFSTNYDIIIARLEKFDYLKEALKFSRGVRILKQAPLETLICFIISANNNIKRIKKSVAFICEHFGSPVEDDFFAFPTLPQLSKISEQDFVRAGTGYRAPYLVKTIKMLCDGFDLEKLRNMPTQQAREKLLTLAGVGPKVADCILLFGLGHKQVFPVDTWIAKVYNDFFGAETNRAKMNKKLIETFKDDSGIVQQYLFYFKRENENGRKNYE